MCKLISLEIKEGQKGKIFIYNNKGKNFLAIKVGTKRINIAEFNMPFSFEGEIILSDGWEENNLDKRPVFSGISIDRSYRNVMGAKHLRQIDTLKIPGYSRENILRRNIKNNLNVKKEGNKMIDLKNAERPI